MKPTLYCNVYDCPNNKDEQCNGDYITVFQTSYDTVSIHCPFVLRNVVNPEEPLNTIKDIDLLKLKLES